jgi:hypothetical protein
MAFISDEYERVRAHNELKGDRTARRKEKTSNGANDEKRRMSKEEGMERRM